MSIQTIRTVCFNAMDDYLEKKYDDWLQVWPGQVCIGIGNVYWTLEVEAALEDGNPGLTKYGDKMQDLLQV